MTVIIQNNLSPLHYIRSYHETPFFFPTISLTIPPKVQKKINRGAWLENKNTINKHKIKLRSHAFSSSQPGNFYSAAQQPLTRYRATSSIPFTTRHHPATPVGPVPFSSPTFPSSSSFHLLSSSSPLLVQPRRKEAQSPAALFCPHFYEPSFFRL